MATVTLLPGSDRLHGVAVRSATATGKAPLSFSRIFRNHFWFRQGDIYVNRRSLEKRVTLTPKTLEREAHLTQIVAERIIIKSAAKKLGISQAEYVAIKGLYEQAGGLVNPRLRGMSKQAKLLIKIAQSMKQCDPTIRFADFVEICIEAKRMKRSSTCHYKGRDYQVAASLMKDDCGEVYLTFSLKRQRTANVGAGSYKQVNRAVRMSDGVIVARSRQKLKRGLTEADVAQEERMMRLFGKSKQVIRLDGVARRTPPGKNGRRYWFGPLGREDLDHGMKKGLSRQERVLMASEMSKGIAALHKKGIRHFDIKPANFLIGQDGHVVVADLGLAGDRLPDKWTPEYASPEWWRDDVRDQSKVDVWALGVSFYELFSQGNVRPFWDSATTQEEMGAWLQNGDFLYYLRRQMQIDIPGPENERLREMLTNMLMPDPAYRWTLARVQRELEEIQREMAAGR